MDGGNVLPVDLQLREDTLLRCHHGHHHVECAQRTPNYQSSFCRWPQDGVSFISPGVPSSEGVPSCNLSGHIAAPIVYVPVKTPTENSSPVADARGYNVGGLASCNVTASLTNLLWLSTATRLSSRGRPTRPHGPPRRSGAHPGRHPLELSPTSSCRPRSLELRDRQISLQCAGSRGF